MGQIARMFGITKDNKLGFTLIELLIVIAIIGIIAGIAVPMFLGQRTKALISECKTNLNVLFTLQEQFYAEYGRYAPWIDRNNFEEKAIYGKYNENNQNMQDSFPQFRPGDPKDMNFNYLIQASALGQGFNLFCKGKAGSPVEGTNFLLKQDNLLVKYVE